MADIKAIECEQRYPVPTSIGSNTGGFALSREAIDFMIARGHKGAAAELEFVNEMVNDGCLLNEDFFVCYEIARHDPMLVEAVES